MSSSPVIRNSISVFINKIVCGDGIIGLIPVKKSFCCACGRGDGFRSQKEPSDNLVDVLLGPFKGSVEKGLILNDRPP